MKEIKQSETIIIKRSQINFAPYNPKIHSPEAIKEQKRNFERVGFLGGIVWNSTTGNLVSGHKRIMAYDNHYKYDGTNDYDVKVKKVEFDLKTEKEQNIYMDNHNTNTQQDLDLLAEMLPDIDYKSAGLTDADLQIIGVDYLLETEGEKDLADSLEEMMQPQKLSQAEKVAHNKEMKAGVLKDAQKKAEDLNAYVMITFDSLDSKIDFMNRFGFDEYAKSIKGELFNDMIERTE